MAPATTDYSEIQQNEIEALRSIYMEDFEEDALKTGAWNVGCNTFKGRDLLWPGVMCLQPMCQQRLPHSLLVVVTGLGALVLSPSSVGTGANAIMSTENG